MAFTKQIPEVGKWLDAVALEVLHYLQERTARAPPHVRGEIPQPSVVNAEIAGRVDWLCGINGQAMLAHDAYIARLEAERVAHTIKAG